MRKIPVEKAVGMTLGYDITRIVPHKLKYRAYAKGHVIAEEDIQLLKDLGRKHIYVWDKEESLIHEDEGAVRLAKAAAGTGVSYLGPSTGRVNLKAVCNGLLKVQVDQLNRLNNIGSVIFATLHNNRKVAQDQIIAGTRVVPIAIEKYNLEYAEKICSEPVPLLTVKPYIPLWVGVITTGSEVNNGRIRDGFGKVIRRKISEFQGRWMGQVTVPDDPELIALEIQNFVAEGAQLILVTGGMSVDPDDSTPAGIRKAGVEVVFYGAPVLPGSQFMLAYQGSVPICGVPGGALFSRRTTLDLLLPRLFVGDIIGREDIVRMGHGGLCEECPTCHYPVCPFGKTSI